ncbi:hypothetical protein SteCoe_10098 [Stentor coeruleus]|uniref:Uncharacterized protein n=1 Tax=Stentor coeruleus TaxID=5963 RepID=A0A1R2CG78_9CILI|nr:hypothetical protein SteCoe_10098 [Stentor coeruleus]
MLKDLVIHFYTNTFRGSITQGRNMTSIIRSRNGLEDLTVCKELHTSVSSSLMQSILLRGEERVRTVSERSYEALGIIYDCTVYTEKWGSNFFRGVATKSETTTPREKSNFMIGRALYGATEEYKSILALDDQNIGLTNKDMQTFYNISEQVPSKIYINSSDFTNQNPDFKSLSYLIQLMPGGEKEMLTELDESIKSSSFFSQLHEEPLTEENFKHLFSSIHEEIGFRSTEYEFKCNCNKDSMISFIKKLEITELVELKKDTHVITCSHCNEHYELTPKDIDPYIK